MRAGELARQRTEYRRGLVLGFTVAECMLLILFALLLALGAALLRSDRQVREMSARISQLQEADRGLETKVEVLGAIADHKPTEQFFSELTRARELEQQVRAQQLQLVERERAAAKLEEVVQAVEGAPDPKRRLTELAAVGARLEREVAKTSDRASRTDPYDDIPQGVALAEAARQAGRTPGAAQSLLRDQEKATRENATLQGQVIELRNDLKAVGRGGDYPSCWVTPSGQIEYLMDISLNGGGTLSVSDVTPPSRLADRRDLPIPPQLFSAPVRRGQFLAMTDKLLALSNAKNCRYFVIVRDRTGPTQKELFKTLLIGTVEARFYKVVRG
jgi:hypothetical protein